MLVGGGGNESIGGSCREASHGASPGRYVSIWIDLDGLARGLHHPKAEGSYAEQERWKPATGSGKLCVEKSLERNKKSE